MKNQAGSCVIEVAAVLLAVPAVVCAYGIGLCNFFTWGGQTKHSELLLWQFCVIVLPTLEAMLGANGNLYAAIACITAVLIGIGNIKLFANNKEPARATLLGVFPARKRCVSEMYVHVRQQASTFCASDLASHAGMLIGTVAPLFSAPALPSWPSTLQHSRGALPRAPRMELVRPDTQGTELSPAHMLQCCHTQDSL